ncbi:hypothetical protein BJ508DRAFT_349776 [Ascobolus immersus RN42]|uniref:Uncharacterized protein n=1 Tax=Ascobolus immersus RN42 TaxID=1160509 RepID=A0A3N4HWE3_ASCIM|nr:hypothetical protein BJ508DRAFT_349776 [Ascobolus immersus RN42]
MWPKDFKGKMSKENAHSIVGPNTTAAVYLNNAKVKYVLWGHHALALVFRVQITWILEQLSIIVADEDFALAIETLKQHSYVQKSKVNIGLMRSLTHSGYGKFPECAIFEYHVPQEFRLLGAKAKRDENLQPREIVLFPASLVNFSFDTPSYIKHTTVRLSKEKESPSWVVARPTLPGILDSALSMMRLNEGEIKDRDDGGRKFTLRRFGTYIWNEVVMYAFNRKDALRQYRSIEELPKRMRDVADNLSAENKDYYLKLCIAEGTHRRQKLYSNVDDLARMDTDEEEAYDGETWEEYFGVANLSGKDESPLA